VGKYGLPGTQKGAFAEIFSERQAFDNKYFLTQPPKPNGFCRVTPQVGNFYFIITTY
jgi:hypothetical protein